jgi:hypothetical protein
MLGLLGAALYFSSCFAVIDDGVVRVVAPGETVTHNRFRFIDGLLLYLVCFLNRRQWLGDIVAGTVAIRHR